MAHHPTHTTHRKENPSPNTTTCLPRASFQVVGSEWSARFATECGASYNYPTMPATLSQVFTQADGMRYEGFIYAELTLSPPGLQ
jgi:hypothetical protein